MAKVDIGLEAQSLISLVDYQNGAVVSRTLLSKSAGNITLFAFDKQQGLSEHTTSFDALVQVVEGNLDVTVDGELHLLAPGDVLLMPANKPHALQSSERSKMLLVMLQD